jgi:hypothetical protein
MIHSAIVNVSEKIRMNQEFIDSCRDLPSNARCKACKAQPWKIRFDACQTELVDLQMTLDGLSNDLLNLFEMDIGDSEDLKLENYKTQMTHLKKRKDIYTDRISDVFTYRTEKSLTDAYTTWLDKYEKSKNTFEKLETNTLELDQIVKGLVIELQHATTKKKDLQFKLEQIQAKHTDYQIYLTDLTDRQKTHDLHSHQLQFNWYSSLIEYREYVDQYLHFLKTHHAYLTLECKLFNGMLDNCIRKDQMMIEAEEMSQVIEYYPVWVEWKVETEKENVLGLKVTELETKMEDGSCDDSSEFDLAELQRDRDAVEYLSNAFADYREWLFKTQIGPTICSKVNRILQMVCDERPLYLESEWLDKIDTLSWFVRDGNSRSIIEKASGFQRFIIGIGARVAFHQMGFCRTQYSQLFIDEGFTSCDADNLEKVPDFLSSLMQFYGSIYLVTHLEDLKVCSDTHIHISREEGLSQIRYGSEEELAENIVNDGKKKCGRPLKKSVVVTKV